MNLNGIYTIVKDMRFIQIQSDFMEYFVYLERNCIDI